MTARINQLREPEEPLAPTDAGCGTPALEQLLQQSRELVADGVKQVRDTGELAFMELESAIAALKWWLCATIMFSTCSVLAGTFLTVAILMMFMDTASLGTVLWLCAGFNVIAAGILVVCIRSLTGKLVFKNLRRQITAATEKPDGNAG